jgi:hypothetical protein
MRVSVCRPGAMECSIEWPTTKVLHERLGNLVNYGILKRKTYPEVRPEVRSSVEYNLAPVGERFYSGPRFNRKNSTMHPTYLCDETARLGPAGRAPE